MRSLGCPDNICEIFVTEFFSDGRQPELLMTQFKSRFRSNKTHNAYVLIDTLSEGEKSVLGYCCSCHNGLRTVGCCSHVMSIIWFSLNIKSTANMPQPAAFLNDYFGEASSSEFDSDEE